MTFKVKYESNPNTNAFTDDEKEKLEKLSESAFEISDITHSYNNNQLTTSITDTNGTVTSNSVTIEASEPDDVTDVSMDLVDGTISTTLTKESGSIVSSIPVVLPESNEVKEIENTIASGQLKTSITLTDDTIIESTPVALPTGGGSNPYIASATHDIFNNALQTTYKLTDESEIKSNAIELPTGGSVSIDAPDNTVVKVVGGELVASGVIEEDGTIKTAPSSVQIGAHKISSIGDALGSTSQATDQQRVLLFQDIEGGITQRPYVYKMRDDDWNFVENINESLNPIIKQSQQILNIVTSGYYIIKPNSITFNLDDSDIEFKFTIYDGNEKIFEKQYSIAGSLKAIDHEAIIIDGVADISFAVTDLDGNSLAVMGSDILSTQKFAFTIREAERAYLAYEGEGGSGGEYPKNPTFETITLDMFAGSDGSKNISFLSDDLTISNREDGKGVLLEADRITFKTGDITTKITAEELDVGFREIINAQSGNSPTSLTTLAQVESMLKNLFLQRVEVTLNDNIIDLNQDYAGKNAFVHGAGLNSGLTLNAANFNDYEVVQITRASDYDNPAIPLQIIENDREIRYLVQGTTTFGIYEGRWLILSDATVTLTEVAQRAAFQQYIRIEAGDGLTSTINQFGVMTLDVVGGGGGDTPSFDIENNTLVMVKNKLPVASSFSEENRQLITDYGQQISGHIVDSRGEVLAINSHSSVTQPINNLGEYSNPKIFKEIDVEQPSTFISSNFHNESIVLPNGQEIIIHSDDYAWVRTEPDTIHFKVAKIGLGYEFSVVDQHEHLIYKYRSADAYDSNATIHIHCPSLTLRANKSYHFIVNDLEGNPLALLGGAGIQSWVFDYRHLEQHELLTNQDSVLPDTVTFMHVKTLQVTDPSDTVGITFNSNGTLEVDGQINLQNHHIINVSDAETDHGATNLKQVKALISNADFEGIIYVDGQPVNDIQLNEDDFVYTYNEFTKVLHLNVVHQGGGGGGNADGTVNPIISENLMTGFVVEFANEAGTFIRSAGFKWSDIQSEHERIWDKLDPAYKTAITAQTEAAANTVAIAHINNRKLPDIEKDIRHLRIKQTSLESEIGMNRREIAGNLQLINGVADQVVVVRNDTAANTEQIAIHTGNINGVYEQIEGIEAEYATVNESLTALETEVGVIQNFPLERMASGQFEEQLYVSDSFDSLTSSGHYVTPYGSEVEYALPPEQRTSEPSYTVSIKVDGQTHEALRLTTTAIRANMKPIKDVLDGVDAQDAVTVNQLVPINEAITKIHDRLSVIEAMLGIISPPPDEFIVYKGRMDAHMTDNAELIKALDKVEGVTESTLLTTELTIAPHEGDAQHPYSYSVIAYPKGVVSPDPLSVSYDIFPNATRESYEIVIDGVMYIVLVPEYPDGSTNPITYKLVQ